MQLIKSGACNLPMRFLVEITQRHRVSEQQIQLLGHFQTYRLFQLQRQSVRDCSISLNLASMLVNPGLCVDCGLTGGRNFLLGHSDPPDSFEVELKSSEAARTARACPAQSRQYRLDAAFVDRMRGI